MREVQVQKRHPDMRVTVDDEKFFDLALHHWKQPIEKIWPIPDLKLWSPTPGVPSDVIAGEELRSEWWR